MHKFIEDLFKKRSQWIDANRANGFDEGIATLLKELYPDNAHFIYELLQNAEDAEASEVTFKLAADNLCFIHNGRDFEEADVDGITGIGNTKKKDDLNSIGKFGVGFKAVFSYTNSPYVHCDSCSFGITDMVCPINENRPKDLPVGRTRFDFPFDNPKKSKQDAFEEIRDGLNGFSSATLLFLHNIETIRWEIAGESKHYLSRKEDRNSLDSLPVFSIDSDSSQESLHWLRLSAPCKEEPAHPVSIAIQLSSKKVKKGEFPFAVAPAEEGRLCIFFPADKEKTGLKFHIHAPFVSTVDRASIPYKNRDNISLRDQLARLLAASLPILRDAGLLTSRFLDILPNSADELGEFYKPFIATVVSEMQTSPLVPTAAGGFSVAGDLARGPKRIRDFISDDDLFFLSDEEYREWAVGTFGQRAEQFLKDLGIPEWTIDEIVEVVSNKWGGYYNDENSEWLKQKDISWLRSLYLCLADARADERLPNCAIILASDESYKIAADIVFESSGDGEGLDNIYFVHLALLKGDRDKVAKIRAFLESLGVSEVEEKHLISSLLKKYYGSNPEDGLTEDLHLDHMKRFVHSWQADPSYRDIYKDYSFLLGVAPEGHFFVRNSGSLYIAGDEAASMRMLFRPTMLFIDTPYENTKLDKFFSSMNPCHFMKYRLDAVYEHITGFREFALELGVFERLGIEVIEATESQPETFKKIGRRTQSTINSDYFINGFCHVRGNLPSFIGRFNLGETNSFSLSYQIWRVMCEAPKKVLTAQYVPNEQRRNEAKTAPSFIVKYLIEHAWVPDKEGNFHKPGAMTRDQLPTEFVYDDNNGWLTAIGFGSEIAAAEFEQEETTKRLRKEGIDLSYKELKEISAIPKDDLRAFVEGYSASRILPVEFPEHESKNQERRERKTKDGYGDAEEKKSGQRKRTVRTSAPKIDPKTYLEPLYKNASDQLVCQMCRHEMPFKLRDGSYYFEAVQIFDEFKKEAHQLYLALCPVCAAKYKTLVKKHEASIESFKEALIVAEGTCEFSLEMHDPALPSLSVRFVQTHLQDIRTVLSCENEHNDDDDIEELIKVLEPMLLHTRVPLDIRESISGEVIIPANRKITRTLVRRIAEKASSINIDPSPISIKIMGVIDEYLCKLG